MKKLILILIMLIPLTYIYGQNKKVEEMIKEIEGQWTLDENGAITYSKIIDLPGLKKDEIYTRVINYFTYNYTNGKSVIQSKDKEEGIVVGKGLFSDLYQNPLSPMSWCVWHILRVDIKDERIRIILSLTKYDLNGSEVFIKDVYPVVAKSSLKNGFGTTFYNAHKLVFKKFDEIEKEIKNGNTSKKIEQSNW